MNIHGWMKAYCEVITNHIHTSERKNVRIVKKARQRNYIGSTVLLLNHWNTLLTLREVCHKTLITEVSWDGVLFLSLGDFLTFYSWCIFYFCKTLNTVLLIFNRSYLVVSFNWLSISISLFFFGVWLISWAQWHNAAWWCQICFSYLSRVLILLQQCVMKAGQRAELFSDLDGIWVFWPMDGRNIPGCAYSFIFFHE